MDLQKQKLLLKIAFILMLIGIIVSYILQLINPSFFVWLETIISYKALSLLLILTILLSLYILSSQKLYFIYRNTSQSVQNELPKRSEKEIEKEQEKLLKNLSDVERLCLTMSFTVINRTVADLRFQGDIITLVDKGILRRLTDNNDPTKTEPFQIADWARVYLTKHS
jgi:hypothetical protein